MELQAIVQYLGDNAHYCITRENQGIYHARLLEYEGAPVVSPPEKVLLIRGIRRWLGSHEEEDFVEDLGRAIDARVRSGDMFTTGSGEPAGTA
jgi:hypothetical protein